MGGADLRETTAVLCVVGGASGGSGTAKGSAIVGRVEASFEVVDREDAGRVDSFDDAVLDDAVWGDPVRDTVFEPGFGLRPFFALILNGLAIGARLTVPLLVATVFVRKGFLVVGVVAGEAIPLDRESNTSDVARRRSCIYCTPVGLTALSGWLEVSDWAGTGSFSWGPE
jgi:hypothetical protein